MACFGHSHMCFFATTIYSWTVTATIRMMAVISKSHVILIAVVEAKSRRVSDLLIGMAVVYPKTAILTFNDW